MTDTPVERLGHIASNVSILAGLLEGDPAAVRDIDDGALLALDAWTAGESKVIHGECVRRAESGRRFTAHLAQQQLTHDELTVVSDVLRRVRDGDVASLGYFTGKPHFETALEKIDDAKIVTRPGRS